MNEKKLLVLGLLFSFCGFCFADGIKVFRVSVNKLTETSFEVPWHITSVQAIYTDSSTDGLIVVVSYTDGEVSVVNVSDHISTFHD